MPEQKQKIQIQYFNPAEIEFSEWNPNYVPPENMEKLEASLDRLSNFRPILLREFNGKLVVIGGEHRLRIAKKRNERIPAINLGVITDQQAKEIALADNARFGHEDAIKMSELVLSLPNPEELTHFLPMTESDLDVLTASAKIDLDALEDLTKEEDRAPRVERTGATFKIMRFKVPVADAIAVEDLIHQITASQGFTESDSLTNAGDALVYLCNNFQEN